MEMAKNEKRIIDEAIKRVLAKEAMDKILKGESKPTESELREIRDRIVQSQRTTERVVRELGQDYVGITVEMDLLLATVYSHFYQNHPNIKPSILYQINRILLEENESAYFRFVSRVNKISE